MHLFHSLKDIITQYLPEHEVDIIREAYVVARDAHDGQMRSSGEPYIIHPVAVARLLADMRLDHETLAAALLHDVMEDTEITKEDIQEQFGPVIADLVDGVTKIDKLKFADKKEAQAENFRKMIMAMVQDIRVILLKLADRTHNMRTLGALRPDKRRRIAKETLEIYAPLAHRLGIHSIKVELEELGFAALYPNRSKVLKSVIALARGNRKEIINKILSEIKGRLEESDIPSEVFGREKNLYSIYNKMKNKEQKFHSIMDIYAFRIIVKDLDTCYRVLGSMHNLYNPKPGRVKDYIAVPKANGYQSLHTSMVGPHGAPVEVQIRTDDMNQMAEKGVAAHWSYKDNNEKIDLSNTAHLKAQRWMQSLLELQQSIGNSFEFIEHVKSDLFPNEIYVFSPKGKIIELPVGATAVDFAYAVHTDLGHKTAGARVNRAPYPLSKPLKNGQTVEIISSPKTKPKGTWLNYVVTSRARTKIRQALKSMKKDESITLGEKLLKHALGKNISIEELPQDDLNSVLNEFKLNNLEELYINIGLGKLTSFVVARKLKSSSDEIIEENEKSQFAIKGASGILTHFANCCHPIPGDPIIAYMSNEKGLVVHTEDCSNIKGYQNEPEKYLSIEWEEDFDREFMTVLKIDMHNRQGILADLTHTIAKMNSNIQKISTEEKDGRLYTALIHLTTKNRVHLAQIIKQIRIMQDIVKVSRLKN